MRQQEYQQFRNPPPFQHQFQQSRNQSPFPQQFQEPPTHFRGHHLNNYHLSSNVPQVQQPGVSSYSQMQYFDQPMTNQAQGPHHVTQSSQLNQTSNQQFQQSSTPLFSFSSPSCEYSSNTGLTTGQGQSPSQLNSQTRCPVDTVHNPSVVEVRNNME